jgi:hypothetical protein
MSVRSNRPFEISCSPPSLNGRMCAASKIGKVLSPVTAQRRPYTSVTLTRNALCPSRGRIVPCANPAASYGSTKTVVFAFSKPDLICPKTRLLRLRRPIQGLPHPYVPPLATIGARDLPGVELPRYGVQATITGRLNLADDWQDIGRKLRRLGSTGHAHATYCAGRVGLPNRLPRALAAARAALIRSEIASRSCSATAAGR